MAPETAARPSKLRAETSKPNAEKKNSVFTNDTAIMAKSPSETPPSSMVNPNAGNAAAIP